MLTLKQLRENKEEAIRRLAKKGVDAAPIIATIELLDDKRKALQNELDGCLAEQNQAAKQIGMLMGKGLRDEAEEKKNMILSEARARAAEIIAEAVSQSGFSLRLDNHGDEK